MTTGRTPTRGWQPDDQFGGPAPDDAHLTGVIFRLNPDGSTPADNPFIGLTADALAPIEQSAGVPMNSALQMGLQVPCGVRAQATTESHFFGQTRRQLGPIFQALARQKECQILEGHLMPDHVQMCIAIPPKDPVVSVIGFLQGKSAIAVARLRGKDRNFSCERFWAHGYTVFDGRV
jgi:hypothetical protein